MQSREQNIKFKRLNDDIPIPKYAKEGDVGLDLICYSIEKYERAAHGDIIVVNTGIAVSPPPGYHFKLYNRSSLHKMGYCLANNVGVIDEGYTGFIYAPLLKIKNSTDLENLSEQGEPGSELIGKRIVQLILEKSYNNFPLQEVNELENTERGSTGFGSSGK